MENVEMNNQNLADIPAIEVLGLTKKYGKKLAVDNLSLTVPRGSVFAFLGRNGAGKSTTIRCLMDLETPTSGSARMLGLDCRKGSRDLRSRVGYVSEGQKMYDWMTVDETIWFCKGFYQTWNDTFASDLKRKLELPGGRKLRELSRGMQAKVALLVAMAFGPDLLVLDEPTAGLDVVVRRDFLEGVIELIQEEGRTVFFSSHLVHEVERIADWVGLIDEGKLLYSGPVQDLKDRVKRIVVSSTSDLPKLEYVPHQLKVEASGRQAAIIVDHFAEETLASLRQGSSLHIEVEDLGLEDIFVSLLGNGNGEKVR